jgi:hypothetical protein
VCMEVTVTTAGQIHIAEVATRREEAWSARWAAVDAAGCIAVPMVLASS